MYTRQHKPVANQSVKSALNFKPKTKEITPPDPANLQSQSEEIKSINHSIDGTVFSRQVVRPQPRGIQLQLKTSQSEDQYQSPVAKAAVNVVQHTVPQSEIIHRDEDPTQVAGGKTGINPQDIDLEQIGHGMVYQDQLKASERQWLQQHGYQPQWYPDNQVVDAGSGLHYGLLLPTPEGKALGREPILAFRGTSDLATAWQDLDINSPGHGGIQQLLKGFATAYVAGIVGQYGKLVVTGHSLGGALAQHFTGAHPELVKRLVTFQSAAPNAKQYQGNINKLKKEDRPEVVHHIAKGDVVDLAGGQHLDGTFFEHDLEATGLASVSTLARIKQAHTSKLLNTEDVVGANQTLANGEKATGKHEGPIKEYHGNRPYSVKSRLVEAGRMTALNKGTVLPVGLPVVLGAAALSVPEIILRGTGKGLVAGGKLAGRGLATAGRGIVAGGQAVGRGIVAGGKAAGRGIVAAGDAIADGASSLANFASNLFSSKKKSKIN